MGLDKDRLEIYAMVDGLYYDLQVDMLLTDGRNLVLASHTRM